MATSTAKSGSAAGSKAKGTKKKAKKAGGAKRTRAKKINKSQAIRDYAADHPDDGPTAVTKALAAKGIKVSPPQVSNVLSAAAKKKGVKKRRGRKPGSTNASKAADKVSLTSLIDAQKFAEKVGGVESAKELLAALDKLKG